MKVIILGGCGGMGRYASKAISSFDQSLTIADLNKEDAEEFANLEIRASSKRNWFKY